MRQTGIFRASVGVILGCCICQALTRFASAAVTPTTPAEKLFETKLAKADQLHHALDRLTFGARPDDVVQAQRLGFKKWIQSQLHPDKIAENPSLSQRLAPYESLRMSVRQLYLSYPPPQLIAATARGNRKLPDDPELRQVVSQLAQRYLQKKSRADKIVTGDELAQNDESDLDSRTKLADLLSLQDIQAIQQGTPEQKKQVLASIPTDRYSDFTYALRPPQRRQLWSFAPIALRRKLMLSVAPRQIVAFDMAEAKLVRAIYSNRQLEELLVDFWYNHFNVYIDKNADRYLVPSYEQQAIRPHVLGKFHDLLLATAKSPAMMIYLDNAQSVSPDLDKQMPNAKRPRRGLNENYARELMELHTLGVDGGYTQKDVVEVARCFTGWSVENPRQGSAFRYNDRVHDKGSKVVLGHTIKAGGGLEDGLAVLDILSQSPVTARHISLQLAQRFVADDPPAPLVDKMTKTFLKSKGDLRKVMETMLLSPEFSSSGSYRAKVKTPFEMIASAARVTNADVSSAFMLAQEAAKLGEPLYRKIEPTGYSSINAEWINSASLLERMNFALALTQNRVPGVTVSDASWQDLSKKPADFAKLLLGIDPSQQTLGAVEKAITGQANPDELAQLQKRPHPDMSQIVAGLILGSPDFQRR